MRELSWVAAGFGWFAIVSCCIGAIACVGMATDGTLAELNSAERAAVIVGVTALNLAAVGLIALGNADRLAKLLPNLASGPTLPGTLPNRFRLLGDPTGRTRGEIATAVGKPVGVTQMPTNTLVQWAEDGCQMALFFDGAGDAARCQGIASVISV